MEKVNVLNEMEKYDFSTPINITMIFEEDSNEDINCRNVLKEQIQNNNDTTQEILCVQEITKESNKMAVNKSKSDLSKNSILVQYLESNHRELQTHSSNTKENTETCNFTSVNIHNVNDPEKELSGYNTRKALTQPGDIMGPPSYVNHLLDTVSVHVIIIMKHYYIYCQKKVRNKAIDNDLLKDFNKVRNHYFQLSYSMVVSLILPQEKNEIFMTELIQKTVCDANRVYKFKCQRHHVEPFYIQMISWTKHQKESIKKLELPHFNNQICPREHIIDQFQQTSHSYNGGINNPKIVTNRDAYVRIFSTDISGNEVSINISANTLVNHLEQQNSDHMKETPPKKRKRNRSKKQQETVHVPTQVYNSVGVECSQQTFCSENPLIYCTNQGYNSESPQLPLPYYINQNHTLAANGLNNSYNNQIQHNISQPIHNTQTLHLQNTNLYAEEQQYYQQISGQPSSPNITNSMSRNPTMFPVTGRCRICERLTSLKCSKCNKIFYCSTLCQELDREKHRMSCG